MASNLPYFRFTVQDWQNGKIDIERFELKGMFISICGYYWINDCDLTLDLLYKKFSNDKKMIDELIDLGILKHEKRYNRVSIVFLNIQYDLLSEKRKTNSINGSKGGKAKANAKQTLERKPSYKDKDKIIIREDNNKDKENRDFISFEFLENFNKWIKYKSDRKEKYKSIESEKSFYNKLLKLSNNNPQIAFEIIEQSMANNWAGIFELKTNNQNANKQSNSNERKTNLDELSKLTRNVLQQPFTLIDNDTSD